MGNAGSAIECCGPCSVDKNVHLHPVHAPLARRLRPELSVGDTRPVGLRGVRHGDSATWRMCGLWICKETRGRSSNPRYYTPPGSPAPRRPPSRLVVH